jgi:hypothetical protein
MSWKYLKKYAYGSVGNWQLFTVQVLRFAKVNDAVIKFEV